MKVKVFRADTRYSSRPRKDSGRQIRVIAPRMKVKVAPRMKVKVFRPDTCSIGQDSGPEEDSGQGSGPDSGGFRRISVDSGGFQCILVDSGGF